MSWDATLTDDKTGAEIGSWNYTHNTGKMLRAAADIEDSWWCMLNGMNGAQGAAFLTMTITCLEMSPDKYRAMNPPNGWGSYDTLIPVLKDMLRACLTETPTRWSVSG